MAGLFSGLSGIRQPDALFNDGGPLPPASAGNLQTGFNATTSANINSTSALLNDIKPYAYGESDRISSDINYKNTPVKVQKIVPMLQIPLAASNHTANLSHSVDDGDMAFVLRREGTANSKRLTPGQDIIADSKLAVKMSRVVDAVVNLPTLNYLLALLQTTETNANHSKRMAFFTELGLSSNDTIWKSQNEVKARKFLQKVHLFGSVIGSEKQGGQHEGGSTVDWPVNFITTMCVDGFCDNLVNFWRNVNVHAGDDLVLYLEECEVSRFDLNHYYKNKFPTQTFTEKRRCFQLIPRVRDIVAQSPKNVMHFARSQMSAAPMHAKPVGNAQNDTLNMSGGLMQVTVQPTILGGVNSCQPTTTNQTGYYKTKQNDSSNLQIVENTASSMPLFRERAVQMFHKKRSIHESQDDKPSGMAFNAAPAPQKSVAPAPQMSVAPAPQKSVAPAPQKSAAPAPQKSAAPAPQKSAAPAPQKSAAPAPQKSAAPAPQKSAAPTPKTAGDQSNNMKATSPTKAAPPQPKSSMVKALASGISKVAEKASSSYKASPKSSAPISAGIEGGSGAIAHVLGSVDSKVRVEKL
jgi:hypothetical protein